MYQQSISPSVKAIIPAAGDGTRLGDRTADTPKPLLEVDGTPLIFHVLETAREARIKEAIVVIGYEGAQIVETVGEHYVDVDVTYVHQRERLGLAHAVWQARPHIDGPFVVLNADNVFGTSISPVMEPVRAGEADGAILVRELVDDATHTGVVAVEDGIVADIVEKPGGASAHTWVTTGCYVLPEVALRACALVQPDGTDERELSEAVSLAAQAGYEIEAVSLEGWCVNVNTPEDLREAEERMRTTPALSD